MKSLAHSNLERAGEETRLVVETPLAGRPGHPDRGRGDQLEQADPRFRSRTDGRPRTPRSPTRGISEQVRGPTGAARPRWVLLDDRAGRRVGRPRRPHHRGGRRHRRGPRGRAPRSDLVGARALVDQGLWQPLEPRGDPGHARGSPAAPAPPGRAGGPGRRAPDVHVGRQPPGGPRLGLPGAGRVPRRRRRVHPPQRPARGGSPSSRPSGRSARTSPTPTRSARCPSTPTPSGWPCATCAVRTSPAART